MSEVRQQELRKAAYTGDVNACEALAMYLIERVKSKIKKINNGVTRVVVDKGGDCCKAYASLMVKAGVACDFVEAYNNMHFVDEMGHKLKRFDFAGDNRKYIQRVVELINQEGVILHRRKHA